MQVSGSNSVSPWSLITESSATPAATPLPAATQNTEHRGETLTLSGRAENEAQRQQRVDDKYAQAVERIAEHQSAQRASIQADRSSPGNATKADTQVIGLDSLPPLEFFNEADVKAYEQTLMSELSSRGIDTTIAMDLGFDYEGRVVVKNDHPDKAAIEAVFEDDMDLRNDLVKTSNYFLFKEMYELHQQWAEKIDSGMEEELAGAWLVNAVKTAVSKNSEGVTFSESGFQDPFNKSASQSLAMKAYSLK